jgi:hypothetical protein
MEYSMSHIFISYVHENQEQVEKLRDVLISHGLDVWLDRDSIFPGMRWKDAIRQAVKSGAYFVACFSAEYEKRDKSYMNEELMLAVDELRQYSIDRPWFIPVLLSECSVPALSIGGSQTLLDFQWVNLYSNWDTGVLKLLRVLKADEIERKKELIDNYGRKYIEHLGDREPFGELAIETSKKHYLDLVRELKKMYGMTYDPIKLDRS